jgi:small-conductance mechanosensitive channel
VAKPDIEELVKNQLGKFNLKIFLIAAIYFGALTLNLPANIFIAIKGVLFALVGIQIAIILGPLLEPLIKSIPALNKPELKPITARIVMAAKTTMWAVVGLFSLSSLGINTTPLLGGLGVLGLGGALAFQNMMPGFIKILSFHFSKSFSIGDKISAGTHQGVVEEIDISTTKIKKATGEVTDVKNEELLTAIVIPADGPHFISDTIKINLNIANEAATFSSIENIFKSCLQNIPETTFERVVFTEFKGAGVACDLNYSVLIDKKIDNKHLILSKLITELKSKNISFTGI